MPSPLPADLADLQKEIEGYARDYGLDPIPVIFEVLDYDEMNEIAAYGGFPTRYPHWRHGMEYEGLARGYQYGLQKIYEMVINNDPCHAYLLRCNAAIDQKLVMAHVMGHSDFFKNNLWFSQTDRKMVDTMANHGTRIRRYIERYGEETVETFVDACLSIENLIDPHSVYSTHRRRPSFVLEAEEPVATPRRLAASKEYMDRYMNPPSFIEEQQKKIEDARRKKKNFPESSEKDVLYFLMQFGPLENWQRDVLSIVREESYYFAPQAMTKVMNEGWASFWHSTIMTQKAMNDSEVIDFADHHSGTMGMRPGSINPYKVGIELYRDIEERWNKGRFGPEWDECHDVDARRSWDRKLGLGRQKIFEVRKIYNDVTFIDAFLTKEFCVEHKMFVYTLNPQTNRYEISNRDFAEIKKQFLFRLTNMGQPLIVVKDGNYANRGELLLSHLHEGFDLEIREARDTLRGVHRLWQRPVHIETRIEDEKKIFSFDGEKHRDVTVEST